MPTRIAETRSPRSRCARLAVLHHCTSCHRPDLSGQQQVPRLAGQDTYLLRLLRAFKAKTASDLDGTMTMSAQPLRDEDIERLVDFHGEPGEHRALIATRRFV